MLGIRRILDKRSDASLADLTITMKHFPIEGYKVEKWAAYRKINKFSKANMLDLKNKEFYKYYKSRQQKVAKLEKMLIAHARFKLSKKLLLNKGKQEEQYVAGEDKEFDRVMIEVCEFMKIE